MSKPLLISLAVLAGIGVLLREAAPGGWVPPTAVRVLVYVLLAAAVLQIGLSRGGRAVRAWVGMCLLALALGSSVRDVVRPLGLEEWRAPEDARLRRRFEETHAAVRDIDAFVRGLARDARALLPDSVAGAVPPDLRARLFESLEQLVGHASNPWVYARGIGVQFLVKERAPEKLERLPSAGKLDLYGHQFLLVSFLFLGVMIVAGSLWAHQSWGRYWAWDPIESTALATWIASGVILHFRILHGWGGRRMAWLTFLALLLMVLTLYVVVLVTPTIHNFYMVGGAR